MKHFMSILLLITVFTHSCLSQATTELENLYEHCINETQVDRIIAEKARSHDLTFDDPKGKCFLKCICSNAGFCDQDLKLVTKFLEQGTNIDKEKIRQAGKKCSEIVGHDDCDTIFQRFKCFFGSVPETPVH